MVSSIHITLCIMSFIPFGIGLQHALYHTDVPEDNIKFIRNTNVCVTAFVAVLWAYVEGNSYSTSTSDSVRYHLQRQSFWIQCMGLGALVIWLFYFYEGLSYLLIQSGADPTDYILGNVLPVCIGCVTFEIFVPGFFMSFISTDNLTTGTRFETPKPIASSARVSPLQLEIAIDTKSLQTSTNSDEIVFKFEARSHCELVVIYNLPNNLETLLAKGVVSKPTTPKVAPIYFLALKFFSISQKKKLPKKLLPLSVTSGWRQLSLLGRKCY
eukprot:m.323436 g.323436  ORF g.323436 m.323436 type:complete len:269 (+) comp16538_c1_seq39:214-1020(+)